MNITFIGGGNMAGAIIGGLRGQGRVAGDILVVEPAAAQRDKLLRDFGVRSTPTVDEAARQCDVLVLAVKPQQAQEVLQGGLTVHAPLIISIMAGVTLRTISQRLGAYERLIRAMPNTPALIGAGISGYYPFPGVAAEDIQIAETILQSMGTTIQVHSEEELDVVTAVSGSGPAYVFHFIEALRDAGQELGLSAEAARKLAIETFLGSAKLAAQSAEDVVTLRQRVTSKGGTTEAALASMVRDRVKEAIIRAVAAARDRSRELGAQMSEAMNKGKD